MDRAEAEAYCAALLDRFANPRIGYALAQIATDGSQKLPVRLLPVLRAERAAGRLPDVAVTVLAAWLLHLRGPGVPVRDVRGDELRSLAARPVAGRRPAPSSPRSTRRSPTTPSSSPPSAPQRRPVSCRRISSMVSSTSIVSAQRAQRVLEQPVGDRLR